jgi:hypothetical protein
MLVSCPGRRGVYPVGLRLDPHEALDVSPILRRIGAAAEERYRHVLPGVMSRIITAAEPRQYDHVLLSKEFVDGSRLIWRAEMFVALDGHQPAA